MARFEVLVELGTRDIYVVEGDDITTKEEALAAYDDGAGEFLRGGDIFNETILDVWEVAG